MKTASLILLIAGCVLVRGVAYATVAKPAPQQSSGNSITTDAGSDHSSDKERATVSSQKKDRKKAIAPHERADRRHIPGKLSPHTHAGMSKTSRAKQVQHDREHSRPEDVRSMHQQVPTKPSVAASKVVSIHTLPVRPATGVAISGQQFRNGRNRNATPAVIGGPANTRRNTAAINGTEASRRPLN